MLNIVKFAIGVKPPQNMFRVSSLSGSITDEVLLTRGKNHISDDYYDEVLRKPEPSFTRLRNTKTGNSLHIDMEQIIFMKDLCNSEKNFDINKAISEFTVIWNAVNKIIGLKSIRRIGIFGAHQIDLKKENPSQKLLEKLTTFSPGKYPARFKLRFEERKMAKDSAIPDFKKDDFINIISDFYDGEIDEENPKENCFNANLDVQRYYSPLFEGHVQDEILKLKKLFYENKEKFENKLKEKGIL